MEQVQRLEKQRGETTQKGAQEAEQNSGFTPELTKEILETEKSRNPEKKYKPNEDFYKLFSDIIGGRPIESKKPVVEGMQHPEAKVTNAIESIIFKGSPPGGSKVKQDQKVNESGKSEPSIFERLGYRAAAGAREAQDSGAELEDSKVNVEFSGKTETGERSESSVFERLSHGADVKEQDSEVNIESSEEMEKSEKPAVPSIFDRLSQGADAKAQEAQASEADIKFDERMETGKRSEPSIFERIAHEAHVKEQNSEVKAEPAEKKEKSKKELSLFERIGRGSIENKRS